MSLDLHEVALGLLIAASILSLLLLITKALGKEFEDTAVVWIRAFKRIRSELQTPLKTEQTSQPRPPLNRTHSRRELNSDRQ